MPQGNGPAHVIYDRKSPRHAWQVVGAYDTPEPHAVLVGAATRSRDWAASRPGWEQYQQGVAYFEDLSSDSVTWCTLPKQTKLAPYPTASGR